MFPTVDIIFPCRDRAWILPYFLDCILNLDYPKDKISIITYLNDSKDESREILCCFKSDYEDVYNRIDIYTYDLGTPEYDNQNGDRGGIKQVVQYKSGNVLLKAKRTEEKVYKSLAKLRNHLLAKCQSEYVFSVDTDILFESYTLKKLLEANKDMISALICNGYIFGKKYNVNPYNYMNIMYKADNGLYFHIKDCKNKGIIPVDLTGAISLMSNKLVKSGARYYNISALVNGNVVHYGEDAGFCESAKKLGFEIFCDTDLKCSHIMNREYLKLYLKGEFRF